MNAATHFFPTLPPSVGADTSPPQPQPHGCLQGLWFPKGLKDPWKLWANAVAQSVGTDPCLVLPSLASLGFTEDV